MSEPFTIDDLKQQLSLALGEDEDIDLGKAPADACLTDLGIDSLAVIDASNRIERALGIRFSEGSTVGVDTLGEFLELVHGEQARQPEELVAAQPGPG